MIAAPASAHATVVSSFCHRRAAGFWRRPGEVVITFNEPVGIGGIGYLDVTN